MKRIILPFLCLLVFGFAPIIGQVNYSANDVVIPYDGQFRPGVNLGYHQGTITDNKILSDLATGTHDGSLPGVGAKTHRASLASFVLETYGYGLELDNFEHYAANGMVDLTAIVGFPPEWHKDLTSYSSNCSDHSELFRNLYTPIWDNGENGTPVNDDNYFALYLYKLISVYGDYVKFWEIWNEPGFDYTFSCGWRPPGDPVCNWWDRDPDPCEYKLKAPIQHYVRTLRIAYDVIKTLSPDDYVAIAGVGYTSFLDAILRNTDNPNGGTVTAEYPLYGGAYFDVMGFHSYPHFDGSTVNFNQGLFARHSDGAAEGVIDRRLEGYLSVLRSHGYNGSTFPLKEHIITEINVPRQHYNPEYFGSELGQINFIQKTFMINKVNNIRQMHVYALADEEFDANANTEFHRMGLYKKFTNSDPAQQVRNNEAIAYKTASELIFETDYDATRTAQMNLPQGIAGYAFKASDGRYMYALWAKTQTDFSEQASGVYSFPSSFNIGQMEQHDWQYSDSGVTTISNGQNITLNSTPIYLKDITNEGDPRPSVELTTNSLVAYGTFSVSAEFSETVSGLAISDINVTNATISNLVGSGQSYTFDVNPLATGFITISIPENSVTDASGQANFNSNKLTVLFKYCNSKGNAYSYWISNVNYQVINNSSDKSGYSDFSSTVFDLAKGQPTTINITTSYSGFVPDVYIGIWLDANQNGQFEASERVYQGVQAGNSQAVSSQVHAATFIVPSGALDGQTRLRISISPDNDPMPCGDIGQGEVEDYGVQIGDGGGNNTCVLTAAMTAVFCDNNGTDTDPSDDTYTFKARVSGANTSSGYTATILGGSIQGTYNTEVTYGPFPISGGAVSIMFEDNDPASDCNTSLSVQPPPTCSDGVDPGDDYCMPQSEFPWHEWIAGVEVGTFENLSDKSYYTDYSNLNINLNAGSSYPVTLTTGFSFITYNEYWRIWIDFNEDKTFQPSELVFNDVLFKPANGTTSATLTGTIQIPASVTNGAKRMRVSLKRGSEPGPCEDVPFGEIEDYTVNIGGITPSCSITGTINGTNCNGLGTPSTADDEFTFDFNVDGTGYSGTQYEAIVNGTSIGNFVYGVNHTSPAFPISGGFVDVIFKSLGSPSCEFTTQVQAPAPCSDPGTDYCTATSSFPWHEWITNVGMKTINKTSGKSTYSDFTSDVATVDIGERVEVQVTIKYSYFTFDDYVDVWIDFNNNDSFESGERVVHKKSLAPNAGTSKVVNAAFTVPNNAVAGNTRMRIIMSRNESNDPCSDILFGEIEDYSVFIQGATNCSITPTVGPGICNDKGTSFALDDVYTFSFSANITGTTSSQYTLYKDGTAVGTYSNGQVSTSPEYVITQGNAALTFEVNGQSNCTASVVVSAPGPCSNSNPQACTPDSDFPWHDWIANIAVNTINNPSSKSAYSDFTNLMTTIDCGQDIPMSLTAGYSWFTFDEHWSVWVDMNQDGAFSSSELLISSDMNAPANGTTSQAENVILNVPTSAQNGMTTMRIGMSRNPITDPCATINFGEFEDYSLMIQGGQNIQGGSSRAIVQNIVGEQMAEGIRLAAKVTLPEDANKWVIQKSNDGTHFQNWMTFDETTVSEEVTDKNPVEGLNYYRTVVVSREDHLAHGAIADIPYKNLRQVDIFPNPAKDELYVDLTDWYGQSNVSIEIVNSHGEMIRHIDVDFVDDRLSIDLADLPQGIYYLRLDDHHFKAQGRSFIITR